MELVNVVFATENGFSVNLGNGANFGYVCIVLKRGRKMNSKKLYKKAVDKWGKPVQMCQAVEECAELIVALTKKGRYNNGSTVDEILEEMADVEIMIEQLKYIFNYDFQLTPPYSKFHAIKKQKLMRLKKRLET